MHVPGWLRLACWSLAIPVLLCLAVVELGLAFPVPAWLYAADLALFAVALLAWPRIREPTRRSLRPRHIAFVIAATIIVLLDLVPWTSRKTFLRRFDRITIGMSESEVRQIMEGYLEGTGMQAVPREMIAQAAPQGHDDGAADERGGVIIGNTGSRYPGSSASGEMVLKDALVFRHAKEGRFNADWGIVSLRDGQVVGTEFSPD